jgi:hypothetical protein
LGADKTVNKTQFLCVFPLISRGNYGNGTREAIQFTFFEKRPGKDRTEAEARNVRKL